MQNHHKHTVNKAFGCVQSLPGYNRTLGELMVEHLRIEIKISRTTKVMSTRVAERWQRCTQNEIGEGREILKRH